MASSKHNGLIEQAEVVLPVAERVELPKHDRATRIAAIMKMADLWEKSGNGNVDGVAYQKRMRAEWQ